MGFRSLHIATLNSEPHQSKVNEALEKLKSTDEIYEVQHAIGGDRFSILYSTLIIYRSYDD